MTDDVMSRVMFWVGAMFALTPLLVIAVVVVTTRHLRRKNQEPGAERAP